MAMKYLSKPEVWHPSPVQRLLNSLMLGILRFYIYKPNDSPAHFRKIKQKKSISDFPSEGQETDFPPAWGFREVLLSSHIAFSLTYSHRDQRKLKLNNCLLQGHFVLKCLEHFSLPHSQFFNIIRESNHYKTRA